MAEKKLDELILITTDILEVFKENLNNARLMPYIFNFLDHLLSSGCLDVVFKSISLSLLTLIRTEMTSGSKPLKVRSNFCCRVTTNICISNDTFNVPIAVADFVCRFILSPTQRRSNHVRQVRYSSSQSVGKPVPSRAQNHSHKAV